MSKSNAQTDTVEQWIEEAKDRLRAWGRYYRAGFSGLWFPGETPEGRARRGHVQQPLNVWREENQTQNQETDEIVAKLPAELRRALVEYYGLRVAVRRSAVAQNMKHHAYRALLDRAESAVAMGLSFRE